MAGAVYGMEHEAERYASINGGHWNEEVEDRSKNDRDLEKGVWEHAEYCAKDACPYFANQPFPYTPIDAYTDIPLTSSTSSTPSEAPTGDAMTAEYCPSINSSNETAAEASARHTFAEVQCLEDLRYERLETQTQTHQFQAERVSFASRKLFQENVRLRKKLEKMNQEKMEKNREKVKKELARLARIRAARKEKEAKEQTAFTEEEGLRCAQATAVSGDDLRTQLAAVVDTATASDRYSCFGSGAI